MDVWRSATTTSGAQCVMTFGALLMPMWSADSWDSMKTQVMHFCWQIRPEPNIAPILDMSGFSHTICAPWVGEIFWESKFNFLPDAMVSLLIKKYPRDGMKQMVGKLHCCNHRQYRFQNGLKMEKHPRCSVKTLMHAKNA